MRVTHNDCRNDEKFVIVDYSYSTSTNLVHTPNNRLSDKYIF